MPRSTLYLQPDKTWVKKQQVGGGGVCPLPGCRLGDAASRSLGRDPVPRRRLSQTGPTLPSPSPGAGGREGEHGADTGVPARSDLSARHEAAPVPAAGAQRKSSDTHGEGGDPRRQ